MWSEKSVSCMVLLKYAPPISVKTSPPVYIHLYLISPYRQSGVLGDPYSEKPVWDRASIFFVLQPIQLNILGTKFGGYTSMLRWVLTFKVPENRDFCVIVYINLSITTLASRFTTFSFQLLFQLFHFTFFGGFSPWPSRGQYHPKRWFREPSESQGM